jgi:DNA repair protein RadC
MRTNIISPPLPPSGTKQYEFITRGANVISDSDLIYMVCGADTNINLSDVRGKDYYALRNMGLSNSQAVRLLASFELKRRSDALDRSGTVKISSSSDIFSLLSPLLSDIQHEEFYAVYLKRNNNVISYKKISQGGISGTVIDNRIILREAVNLLASGIIAVHNHPSGNCRPSGADGRITEGLRDACKLLHVQLLDHVIIANDAYYSFADEGVL